MREKAKELQRQKLEMVKKGIKANFGSSGGFGTNSNNTYTPSASVDVVSNVQNDVKPPPHSISQ